MGRRQSALVVDPEGNPIENVQVSAGPNFKDQKAMGDMAQFRLRGFAQQSFVGTDGEFVVDGLTPQQYGLSVRGPNFQTRGMDVTVAPSKPTDVGTIMVVKGRVLAGTVIADGQPVAGATVFAGRQLFGNGTTNTASFGPMGQGTKQDTTDASGKFSLSGFSEGDVSIVAELTSVGRSKAMRVPTTMPGQTELVLEQARCGERVPRNGRDRGAHCIGSQPANGEDGR